MNPTSDETAGMGWWNELPVAMREYWLALAGTAVAADAWTLYKRAAQENPRPFYEVQIEDLSRAVATTPPSSKHRHLVRALAKLDKLNSVRLSTERGGPGATHLVTKKVVDQHGQVLASDHRAWLQEQIQLDGGDPRATFRRLKDLDLRLSRCHTTHVYLVCDRGTEQEDFWQLEVTVEDEVVYERLFGYLGNFEPTDLEDLLDPMGSMPLPEAEQTRVRPIEYKLNRLVSVRDFVALVLSSDALVRSNFRLKRFERTSANTAPEILSADDAFPGWDAHPFKADRLFKDWARSSAGHSGARLSDHWVLDMNAYRHKGQRAFTFSYTPMWTTNLKLAKIDASGSIYELFGKLEKLDARVGVPFGWFFFLLHGNRVTDAVAERVIKGAEAGLIVLPERDYRVLKAWQAQPYGF